MRLHIQVFKPRLSGFAIAGQKAKLVKIWIKILYNINLIARWGYENKAISTSAANKIILPFGPKKNIFSRAAKQTIITRPT
mgnify:FL=1